MIIVKKSERLVKFPQGVMLWDARVGKYEFIDATVNAEKYL